MRCQYIGLCLFRLKLKLRDSNPPTRAVAGIESVHSLGWSRESSEAPPPCLRVPIVISTSILEDECAEVWFPPFLLTSPPLVFPLFCLFETRRSSSTSLSCHRPPLPQTQAASRDRPVHVMSALEARCLPCYLRRCRNCLQLYQLCVFTHSHLIPPLGLMVYCAPAAIPLPAAAWPTPRVAVVTS